METLFKTIEQAFLIWSEAVLDVPVRIGLSRIAAFSSPAFVRKNAAAAAEKLSGSLDGFRLFGTRAFRTVQVQNGWLLFEPDIHLLDAYACTLPGPVPGEAIRSETADLIDYRMDMLLRHADADLPDYEPLIWAVLTASHACATGKWSAETERTVLSMLHGLSGKARLEAEQHSGRAAKIILWERMEMRRKTGV